MVECSIIIPSIRPELADEAQKSLLPYSSIIYDEPNLKTCSKVMNNAIMQASNEVVIIVNDKVRAKSEDIEKIVQLLNEGYGLVGLNVFHFFGFKKDLIRKIGFFDERFPSGGFEDNDIMMRMKEADIAHYMKEDTYKLLLESHWNYYLNQEFFYKKWQQTYNPLTITRLLPDEDYSNIYDIGSYQGTKFLPFEKSVMHKYSTEEWIHISVGNAKIY